MTLGFLDYVVLVAYFIGIAVVGYRCGRGQRDTEDFFLGGRRQPWFVVSLSLVATEVSALTFLVVPGRSYESNCWYLQMYVGSLIGRLLIMVLLLVLLAISRSRHIAASLVTHGATMALEQTNG